ncbi:hypothetical protein NXU92_07090 [Bacteroides fragilis]|nr:hypothetical protein [Bacteroides fragilis]
MIKDLTDAINSKRYLAKESSTPGYINVWAAKGLITRDYT